MKNKFRIIFVFFVLCLLLPLNISAETLSSPNYQVQNPEFNAGGEPSNSTTYKSIDSIGGQEGSGSSTTYNGFFGFLSNSYPGVPGIPTLTNTGGNLYNSLDFVLNTGNNTSDTNYAIAMSPDSFATTYYVQANDTLGATEAWQSYTAWGGATGQRVTGLSPNTTYSIKVKARFGTNTETGFSNTVTAATVAPQLTFTISGVPLSTVIASQTTTIGTSANAMSFSTLPVGSAAVAAQQVTVSTNATGGYTTTIFQDGNLRKTNGNQIQPVAASNASPAAWPTPITTGAFGYHTTAASLCTGTATRFSVADTYAAVTTTPTEIACSSAAASSTTTSIVFKLQIGSLQQAGTYSNIITYITTAVY